MLPVEPSELLDGGHWLPSFFKSSLKNIGIATFLWILLLFDAVIISSTGLADLVVQLDHALRTLQLHDLLYLLEEIFALILELLFEETLGLLDIGSKGAWVAPKQISGHVDLLLKLVLRLFTPRLGHSSLPELLVQVEWLLILLGAAITHCL